MQLKKTSNKTAKPAPLASGVTPPEETTTPAAKPRAAGSSKKKNELGDMTSATHHHKAAPMATSQPTPVSSKPADKPSDKPTRTVSQHDIAGLAYSYWVERAFAHGSHEEDWLRAEKELRLQ